jgi:adenylate cyclase
MNDRGGGHDGAPTPERNGSAPSGRRGGLFRKYAAMFVFVVAAGLLASGLLQIWFAYKEQTALLMEVQRGQAKAAADKISQFVQEIERQLGWITQIPLSAATLEQRRFDAQRLLRQVPAITEVAMFDADGRERLRVSRLSMDVIDSDADFSGDEQYRAALADKVAFGPVEFRHDSEPYMAIAVAGNRKAAGVAIADVNLKFIWDVVSQIEAGDTGSAYVVDGRDRLIAHPDISLVLAKNDLSRLAQVRAARGSALDDGGAIVAENLKGQQVLAAYAPAMPLDWHVLVELPSNEAYAPIRAAAFRSAGLLAGGLVLAIFAGLFLARRMTVPIRTLQQGAALIGDGVLDRRIEIRTGDELEDLADQFNLMGERLQQLYGNLERVSQLKRYFSPHLAEMIVSSEDRILGKSHRRDITVLFCDLRGFTAFSSAADPDTVVRVLGEFYTSLGQELRRFEATIGHFGGDGVMAFLNDPLPCPDHQLKIVQMAMAMREGVHQLVLRWREMDIDLGFGIGIASGDATLGNIGSHDQFHYTAIGPVVNLASRLCDEAVDGEILVDAKVGASAGKFAYAIPAGERKLKGFAEPFPVFRIEPDSRKM